jgi:titin
MKKILVSALGVLIIIAQACMATNTSLSSSTSSLASGGTNTGQINTTGSGEVQITWSAASGSPASSIEGYQLEQSTDGTHFTQIQVLSNDATSTTVTGLGAGKTYYFRMRSYNAAGESSYSSTYTAVIPAS